MNTITLKNNIIDFEIIAHRGRIENSKYQDNTLEAIKESLDKGLSVEIDLMKINERFYLGHDNPNFEIQLSEIDYDKVYIHMKTPHIIDTIKADFFFIENDSYALTKKNKIWTNYNNKEYNQDSIMCSAELVGGNFNMNKIFSWAKKAHGICTDFPLTVYKNLRHGKIN